MSAAAVLLALGLLGVPLGCWSEEGEREALARPPLAEAVVQPGPATPPGDTLRGSDAERGSRIARIRTLAAAEARRLGLDATPEMKAAVERLRLDSRQREEELLRDALFARIRDRVVLSDDELRAYYEKNLVRYTERRVRLRRERFASEAEARAADAALGPAGRLDPARTEEIGPLPSAALPGAVGPEALALATPGERALVAGSEGSALVELLEVLPAEPRSFEAVREQVEKSLLALRAQQAFRAELERLESKARDDS